MHERVTAIEHEFITHIKTAKEPTFHSPDPQHEKFDKDSLFKNNPEGVVGYEQLGNAARRYVDTGVHIEYATPEDAFLWGTVTNKIAGERIVRANLDAIAENPRHPIVAYKLNGRLIDSAGNTCGHHENYDSNVSTALRISEESLRWLGSHLIFRNIFAGEGYIREVDGEPVFRLAQKAPNVPLNYSRGTTGKNKPIVNLKTEPEANNGTIRVHVTSGDANMSPWSTWMALGTTSIVLRLIEAGWDSDNITPRRGLVSTARRVADDLTFKLKVPMQEGKNKSALDVEKFILERAWKYNEQECLPPDELEVMDEWQRALDDLSIEPERLEDRSSGIAKWLLTEAYMDRLMTKGVSAEVLLQKLKLIDHLWDEHSDQGIGLEYRTTKWAQWMPLEADIQAAMTYPPRNTRALVRGQLIHRTQPWDILNDRANWVHVKTRAGYIDTADLYQTHLQEPKPKPTADSQPT